MYNIVTVCNKTYQEFLIYFVNSLLKNCDLSKINKIFICSNGVDEELIEKFSNKNEKVVFFKGNKTSSNECNSSWSKEWGDNVEEKTLFLKYILETTKLPTCLIDIDCLFLKDFSELINFDSDIGVCDRHYTRDNKYIASFFYCNYTENAINFLNDWILEQTKINSYPKETLCLNITYKKYYNKIKIQSLDFKNINFYYSPKNEEELKKIYIVHLKGSVKHKSFQEEINSRIDRIKHFGDIDLYKL